jgi:hypothetical protein
LAWIKAVPIVALTFSLLILVHSSTSTAQGAPGLKDPCSACPKNSICIPIDSHKARCERTGPNDNSAATTIVLMSCLADAECPQGQVCRDPVPQEQGHGVCVPAPNQ